jgi:glutathione S-transferase
MSDVYKLYGAAISLYTGKARAYLRYKNVPFIEEPGSPDIFERIGFRMIPVLHTPDDSLVQDTSEIIDHIEQVHGGVSVYPEGAAQKFIALLIEVYGDEWLVMPAMHYRWNYNLDYILQEFGKMMVPDASAKEQVEVGTKMSAAFSGSLPFLGVTEETIPAIEACYEELLSQLDEHFKNHWYLFGTRPSIGDYGLMGPLYAHNFRDPASGDIMKRLAPNVVRWIDLMNTPAPNSGHFLPDDEVPETLLPILKRIFSDCVPAMVDTIRAAGEWIDQNPDTEELPRAIGEHTFQVGGVEGKRMIRPFNQWMFQRPLEFYQSLEGKNREKVDELLRSVGGYELMQTEIRHRLTRLNYRLVVDR